MHVALEEKTLKLSETGCTRKSLSRPSTRRFRLNNMGLLDAIKRSVLLAQRKEKSRPSRRNEEVVVVTKLTPSGPEALNPLIDIRPRVGRSWPGSSLVATTYNQAGPILWDFQVLRDHYVTLASLRTTVRYIVQRHCGCYGGQGRKMAMTGPLVVSCSLDLTVELIELYYQFC